MNNKKCRIEKKRMENYKKKLKICVICVICERYKLPLNNIWWS
jgi:hypothetical protein